MAESLTTLLLTILAVAGSATLLMAWAQLNGVVKGAPPLAASPAYDTP